MPAFDTTPPGMGGRLKPRCARHGNFTPPRIAPSCPQAGVSLCADEVMAKQLVRCFWTGGYRSPPYLAVFYGESPQAGLGAPSRVASRLSGASSGNVFQLPDVTGLGPVFFKVRRGGRKKPPHCVGSERAFFMLLFQKFFKKFFIRLIFLEMTDWFRLSRSAISFCVWSSIAYKVSSSKSSLEILDSLLARTASSMALTHAYRPGKSPSSKVMESEENLSNNLLL